MEYTWLFLSLCGAYFSWRNIKLIQTFEILCFCISEFGMVCWSYKKLCFVILLPYNVVLCCHVDISRGCLQVSKLHHVWQSILIDLYLMTTILLPKDQIVLLPLQEDFKTLPHSLGWRGSKNCQLCFLYTSWQWRP